MTLFTEISLRAVFCYSCIIVVLKLATFATRMTQPLKITPSSSLGVLSRSFPRSISNRRFLLLVRTVGRLVSPLGLPSRTMPFQDSIICQHSSARRLFGTFARALSYTFADQLPSKSNYANHHLSMVSRVAQRCHSACIYLALFCNHNAPSSDQAKRISASVENFAPSCETAINNTSASKTANNSCHSKSRRSTRNLTPHLF